MKTITGKYYAWSYIRSKESFRTQSRNFHANWLDGDYYVWSYWTVIAQYHDGVWYINDTKYSVETAKHNQIVQHAIGYSLWKYSAMHVDHLYRGVSNLVVRNAPRTYQERALRIRKENKQYSGLTRFISV